MGPSNKIKPAASTIGAACRIGNFAVESFAKDNLAVGDFSVESGLRRSFSLWHHTHHQGRKPDSAVN